MFKRLIALPSGEWVDPEIITGIRLEVRKIKRRSQVRVLLDTKRRDGLFIVPFGKIAVAQCWMANIGAACSTGEYLNDDDDDQSFEFLDAVEQHRRHPGTFAMPGTHKLDLIQPGSLVKVAVEFAPDRDTPSVAGERFWVQVTDICQHGRLTGEVKSALVCSPQHGIEVGDVIQFGRNHVLETRAAAS